MFNCFFNRFMLLLNKGEFYGQRQQFIGYGIISLILSVAGITTGVIILIVTLKKKKEENIAPIPVKSKTIKCEYCGTIIRGKNDSCINCGAAIKDKED